MLWRATADVVVALHAIYILTVVLGFVAILIGAALQWRWVRNFYFRVIHFAMILLVCLEAATGSTCPLTSLESALRLRGNEAGYPHDFVGYWLDRLIFYDAPAWMFLEVYLTFGMLVLLAFWIAPVRLGKASR
jgi:Protein of Unknown function (DUF2784)